jgi:hypothetical protein
VIIQTHGCMASFIQEFQNVLIRTSEEETTSYWVELFTVTSIPARQRRPEIEDEFPGLVLQLGSRMNSYWLLRKLEVKYQHMRLTSTRAPRKSVPLLDAVLPNQSLLLHCLYSKNKVGVDRVQTSWPHKYHMRRCGKVGNRFEFSVQ